MSFTRDYSTLTPVDHTLNANWPTNDRNVKQDAQDRLKDIISGFNSGEAVKGVLNLPFIAVSKPSTVTDQIQVYGKVVSTKTELHAVDEDGNEIQLTTGGKINAAKLGGVYAAPSAVSDLVNILPYIYPIGTVLTFGVSTNPATLLGFGTWTAIAGKVIVGIDGTADFLTLDQTGGEKTHTMTAAELVAHTHTIACDKPTDQGGTVGSAPVGGGFSSTKNTGSSGSTTPFNVLQPYIVKYVWQRTA